MFNIHNSIEPQGLGTARRFSCKIHEATCICVITNHVSKDRKKRNLLGDKFTHLHKYCRKRKKKEEVKPGLVKSNADTDTSFLWVKTLEKICLSALPFIFHECVKYIVA